MGGAVSSGRDNNELIDNLMGGNYIRSWSVERIFRVLDRADYMTPEARDQAYKDMAWRNGPLHMSAPCIYSEVMEGLELRPGLSFLNIGSGTGYLSTLAGLVLGSGGISHGVEVHPMVVEYSTKKLGQFIENSPTLDEFDFCEPKFYLGNGLCLAPLQAAYDRVYCGAGCPEEYQNYFKQLIKVGGVLVMPLNDNLIQVRRISDNLWSSRNLLHVSFASLMVPTKEESADLIKLEELAPPRLQVLARAVVREHMRLSLQARHPDLRAPPPRAQPPRPVCPRRICIPIEDDTDVEGLGALHDLDPTTGANEMNALLSLVLSMRQNRVAGALRFDALASNSESDTSSSDDEVGGGNGNGGGGGSNGGGGGGRNGGGGAGGRGRGRGRPRGGRRGRDDDRRDGDDGARRVARRMMHPQLINGDRSTTPVARFCRGILTLEYRNENQEPGSSTGLRGRLRGSRLRSTHSVTRILRTQTRAMTRALSNEAKAAALEIRTIRSRLRARNILPMVRPRALPRPRPVTRPRPVPRTRPVTRSMRARKAMSRGKGKPGRKNGQGATKRKNKRTTKRTIPTEVEIYVGPGNKSAGAPRDGMEWEDARNKILSSDDETKDVKRQKLDSGTSEEASSTGATATRTETKSESSDTEAGTSGTFRILHQTRIRRRAHRPGSVASTSRAGDADVDPSPPARLTISARRPLRAPRAPRGRARAARAPRAPPELDADATRAPHEQPRAAPAGPDARRVRLSIMMKRGVKELPLPYALKKYVNLGRCFQF